VALLFVLIVAVWAFLAFDHMKSHEAVREFYATLVVGYASLLHLDEYGKPPRSVDELFDRGLLYMTADGYVEMPGFSPSPQIEYVRRVRLSFPESVDDYALEAGFVCSKSTGEKLVCIWFDGAPAAGRDWAYLWFRVAHGGATGDDRLDEFIREHRNASSQPASAPVRD